jgi:uridine kinase
VVAVAAPIGGGKSALVDGLAAALGGAPTLRFDDYENATRQSVGALGAWLAEGADFDRLQAPGLADALRVLRARSDAVPVPIVFEMPLGRAWTATAADIDLLVWVDVPLDIALARRVRDICGGLLQRNATEMRNGVAWLNDYLSHYAAVLHGVLQAQRQSVRPQADLVLDGRHDVGTLVGQVMAFMAQRHG